MASLLLSCFLDKLWTCEFGIKCKLVLTYSTPTHNGVGNQSYHHAATFSPTSAIECHWLQPMMVLTVHWWPAPVCVGGLLLTGDCNSMNGENRQSKFNTWGKHPTLLDVSMEHLSNKINETQRFQHVCVEASAKKLIWNLEPRWYSYDQAILM